MVSKLDESKRLLAEYDAFIKEFPNSTMTALDSFASEDTVDYLRALVAVADAAAGLKADDFAHSEWGTCAVCEGHPIYLDNRELVGFIHESDCRVGKLFAVLKALD